MSHYLNSAERGVAALLATLAFLWALKHLAPGTLRRWARRLLTHLDNAIRRLTHRKKP